MLLEARRALLPLSVELAEMLHGLSKIVTHSNAIPDPPR